jgi:hypothetical protein
MLKRLRRQTESIDTDELLDDSSRAPESSEPDSMLSVEDNDQDEEELDEESAEPWVDRDVKGFVISFCVHAIFIVLLATAPIAMQPELLSVVIRSEPMPVTETNFDVTTDIAFSEAPSEEVGSNSVGDAASMALSSAPVLADISEIPTPEIMQPQLNANVDLSLQIKEAVGLVQSKNVVRGMTGVGTTGVDGAVDRITYEILRSIEERPTLVVWLFDASVSLQIRRKEISDRFDRIYKELGIVQDGLGKDKNSKPEDSPLLTSIISFGNKVDLLTKDPTNDLSEIRGAIDSIQVDTSGVELTFSALYLAADKYKEFRVPHGKNGPDRNVMMIMVTDERGADQQGLEKTIGMYTKYAIPVYILGTPAPFGREFTYIKYVDPDPNFDQTPQWGEVDQGPESMIPERVYIGDEETFVEEPVVDSGFGPYALSRLCYETGGIFFSIHPNRKVGQYVSDNEIEPFAARLVRFFDPDIMARYRPDYVSEVEYLKMVKSSPMRQALLQASQMGRVSAVTRGSQRFVKRDEASFANQLTELQQEPARLEPRLNEMCTLLGLGEKHRGRETSARWLASFDLSYAEALAAKVRTETYNLMLAKGKRGLVFEDPKNNTWVLHPSDEISVGSKFEKEAEQAKTLFRQVMEQHEGTPWALIAEREIRRPIGWSWKEAYTDLNPPPPTPPANNPPPPPPPAAQDDQARMIAKPPMRGMPKL